jgi:hypothetical protein
VLEAREEELRTLYAGDAAALDSLIAVLERERVLFLTGERGIGKQTTALYVATRIADVHNLEHSTALIAPLEAQVRFEMRDVTVTGRRVIVFDDALAKKNASLVDIFSRLERVACDRLVDELRFSSSSAVTWRSAIWTGNSRRLSWRRAMAEKSSGSRKEPRTRALTSNG